MNEATKQFFYRALTLTICIVAAAIVFGQIGAVFFFGDGEGLRIVNALQPEGFGLIGAMCVALGLVKLAETHEAVSNNSSGSAASSAPTSSSVASSAPALAKAGETIAELAGVTLSSAIPSIAADGSVKA